MRRARRSLVLVALGTLAVVLAQSWDATATESPQPRLPIRAAFYYPWFPETWDQDGFNPFTNYHPSLGFYDSSDPAVIAQNIADMQYGRIEAGIASWWGQGTPTDGRFPLLLDGAEGTGFRWAVHYEPEGYGDPGVSQIEDDLVYIRDHYAGDPAYLRLRDRFVVFAFTRPNGDDDGCEVARRWARANEAVGAYIVMRDVRKGGRCATHPAGWYEYRSGQPEWDVSPDAFSVSPGFWKKGAQPTLGRNLARWRRNIRHMMASCAEFQTVITFNEWGEGTAVESAEEWASASGRGAYLDALHSVRLHRRDRRMRDCRS